MMRYDYFGEPKENGKMVLWEDVEPLIEALKKIAAHWFDADQYSGCQSELCCKVPGIAKEALKTCE